MATTQRDQAKQYHSVGIDAADLSKFADIRVNHESVIIYDQDNAEAWVQSDAGIGVGHMR